MNAHKSDLRPVITNPATIVNDNLVYAHMQYTRDRPRTLCLAEATVPERCGMLVRALAIDFSL